MQHKIYQMSVQSKIKKMQLRKNIMQLHFFDYRLNNTKHGEIDEIGENPKTT